MAFIVHSNDDGQMKPFEKHPAAADLDLKPGILLRYVAGNLAIASGTNAPEYVCEEHVETDTAGQRIAVSPIDGARIYETELSEADADIARGGKHTIDTTGGKITATTTSGVAIVVDFEGTGAGSKVRVRF